MGGAAAAKPKKGRATQLEMAERAVLKFSTELAEAEGLVASVAGQGPLAAKKDKGKAARAQNRVGDLRSKLEAAQKVLEEKKAAAATAALKAEAAAAEKKAKKEISDPVTEAFLLYFIESVLALQSKFDNSSEVADELLPLLHQLHQHAVRTSMCLLTRLENCAADRERGGQLRSGTRHGWRHPTERDSGASFVVKSSGAAKLSSNLGPQGPKQRAEPVTPLARVLSLVCLRVLFRASVRASGRFFCLFVCHE